MFTLNLELRGSPIGYLNGFRSNQIRSMESIVLSALLYRLQSQLQCLHRYHSNYLSTALVFELRGSPIGYLNGFRSNRIRSCGVYHPFYMLLLCLVVYAIHFVLSTQSLIWLSRLHSARCPLYYFVDEIAYRIDSS